MTFYKLGIKNDLVYTLDEKGIDRPTPIQRMAIPEILKKIDLLAEAQTGTGKTLAFLLPIIQQIDVNTPNVQALVLVPTRELAIQITQVARSISIYQEIGILAAYGGQDVKAQLHKLQGQTHLIIATPGRLLDHIRRESISLNSIEFMVVDEADQMFHIGFKKEVEAIFSYLPSKHQTLCFTATMSKNVLLFSKKHLVNPLSIQAPKQKITLDEIDHWVIKTSGRKKFDTFTTLLTTEKPGQSIIFCRSRKGTQSLCDEMKAYGYSVDALHGDLTQAKRESVMTQFKDGKIQYLVATDVAARGIDVTGLTHVFNYNLPDDPENYVHRIGRTGRAGEKGKAITILTEKDFSRLEAIESFIQQKITRL